MSIEDDQRDFIARIMARTGWSQTELARQARLDHSTLSRFMGGGREGHALRHATIRKLEQASGLRFGVNATPRAAPATAPAGFAETEATRYMMDGADATAGLVHAAMAGKNNLDAWVLRARALENIGFLPGDVLLVALGEQPRPRDIVCAQIYDWSTGQAETVFRRYEPPCLIAVTSDPTLLKPYIVDDGAVAIKGVVTHSFRIRAA